MTIKRAAGLGPPNTLLSLCPVPSLAPSRRVVKVVAGRVDEQPLARRVLVRPRAGWRLVLLLLLLRAVLRSTSGHSSSDAATENGDGDEILEAFGGGGPK